MKENKVFNIVNSNYRSYKLSYAMFLWGLSGVLSILGDKFGMFYLVLSFLPVLAWVILFTNDRNNTQL